MGRIQKILIGAAALLAVIGASAGIASATKGGQSIVSGSTDHSVYQAGNNVNITGTVNGDIFCAGQTVDIDAVVNGDVICAGQTVTVNGTVHGNVRLAGQTVNLGAKVDHNASIAAQDATLQANASIGSDLSLLAQTATVDSFIGRDVKATVNDLTLNSLIGRDVNAYAQTLKLSNNGKIANNLDYTSPNKLTKAGGASIGGKVTYSHSANSNHVSWRGTLFAFHLYLLLSFLILGLVLVALFPQVFKRWNEVASERVWAVLLTGLIAMIIVPAITTALLFTIVGIPLAVLLILIWSIAAILSLPLAAFYVGRLILTGKQPAPLVLLVGAVVLGLVSLIPIIGVILAILAMWFGTGSLLLNLKRLYKKPEYSL